MLDAYFSGTKLKWLLDHVPGARARAERGELAFGTIDSWLIWNLTGGARARHRRDQRLPHAALQHPRSGDWDDELLRAARHPARDAAASRARRPASAARPTLDGVAVPIAGIAGDQQAALFGQACLAPGMAKNTYGTGCFLLLNTGQRRGRLDATTW